ncbi:MAG: hypothetical protein ACREOW_13330 [Thermodesulfobacteriota bacterium]
MNRKIMFTMVAAVLLVSFEPVALKAGEEPDSVRKTVVFLGKKDPSGKGIKPVGTGFLLASEKGVCLITTWHVANALASDAPITLMLGEQTRTLELTEISSTSPPKWVFAEKADIAALKVKPSPEAPLHVFRRAQVLTSALSRVQNYTH